MRQQVTEYPIIWCNDPSTPFSVIGDFQWSDIVVTVDYLIENEGLAGLATRMNEGGCGAANAQGIIFLVDENGNWTLSYDQRAQQVLASGQFGSVGSPISNYSSKVWHTLTLSTVGPFAELILDNVVFDRSTINPTSFHSGWAAIISSFDFVQFDNFQITSPMSANTQCGIQTENPRLGSVYQHTVAQINCPANTQVSKINFAGYGDPAGMCGYFSLGSCRPQNVTEIVESYCLGQQHCEVPVSKKVFGDPCPSTAYYLYVQATCQ